MHYLDKQTDKTLFVDTGTAISMRRTGITEAGVSVALQLARERFGSTLTINGTAEFKKLVIEAVAKNGLDVHFTDKAMNQSLADRRAELEIERGGLSIGPANDLTRHVNDSTRDVRDQADRMGVTVPIEALYGEGKTAVQVSQALATQLDTVPEPERIAFVETVAITLGIPERGQPKGDKAFAQWQAQRAQPAADSPVTATTETQTSAPEPVSTPAASTPATAPVSPEAAKPALVNANDLPRQVDDTTRDIGVRGAMEQRTDLRWWRSVFLRIWGLGSNGTGKSVKPLRHQYRSVPSMCTSLSEKQWRSSAPLAMSLSNSFTALAHPLVEEDGKRPKDRQLPGPLPEKTADLGQSSGPLHLRSHVELHLPGSPHTDLSAGNAEPGRHAAPGGAAHPGEAFPDDPVFWFSGQSGLRAVPAKGL
ncbi:hypothetical protein KPSA1B_200015 (plasmid) [Pseudomonas syringae pv. actinidiae]|uniref:L-2-hydroxyglutarate oxidase LhgO n=2 Tax=Pseudomonas syringae TaxID=317 RepID=A0A2V0QMF4_PSESF|nr:hypothetical protein KPSA1B_200015 [Pseudomonas syringae pv. actinidiae]GBH14111.1 L-2-hydroxyglutarate oxidase LhgO [Pseudomonas syringae pv. actinidiae]